MANATRHYRIGGSLVTMSRRIRLNGSLVPTSAVASPVVSGTVNSNTQITWTWTAVAGATRYDYRIDGGTIVSNGTSTTFVQSGLTAGSAHTLEVRVTTSAGTSAWSAPVTRTTTGGTTTVPNPPTLSGTVSSNTKITWSWTAVSGATAYNYRINGGSAVSNGTSTTFVQSGIAPSTTVTLEVRVTTSGGTSNWSTPLARTTTNVYPAVYGG